MIDIHVGIRYESEEDRLMVIKIINQQNHITRSAFKKLNAGQSVAFNDFDYFCYSLYYLSDLIFFRFQNCLYIFEFFSTV